mmetsp:Transcript_22932/g.58236  ORF Transcript_22932/g.58236 Transcript_22932/m.58236 type:complete len:206 (+) Transcript_22932:1688-2305(+)
MPPAAVGSSHFSPPGLLRLRRARRAGQGRPQPLHSCPQAPPRQISLPCSPERPRPLPPPPPTLHAAASAAPPPPRPAVLVVATRRLLQSRKREPPAATAASATPARCLAIRRARSPPSPPQQRQQRQRWQTRPRTDHSACRAGMVAPRVVARVVAGGVRHRHVRRPSRLPASALPCAQRAQRLFSRSPPQAHAAHPRRSRLPKAK